MSFLEVKNISYTVPDRIILENVSFSVNKGEIVTVIGPNGAGKSTLLKIIAGIILPGEGNIIWADKTVKGYVPQSFFVNNQLPVTVRDFLTLTGNDIEEVTVHTGIEKILENSLSKLSGGEAKKVLLARALIKKPDVLFLDEPTAGLDIDSEKDFYDIIEKTRERYNCTILMVSHNLHMVMAKSNKVICLNRHVCCHGDPSDVMLSSGYLKLFTHHEHHCDHEKEGLPCGIP